MQAALAEAALTVARAQHVRQLQQLQETAGGDCREHLEARLQEEHRRSQQLEEALRHQAQQGSSQISMKQVDAASYMLTKIMLSISMLA